MRYMDYFGDEWRWEDRPPFECFPKHLLEVAEISYAYDEDHYTSWNNKVYMHGSLHHYQDSELSWKGMTHVRPPHDVWVEDFSFKECYG